MTVKYFFDISYQNHKDDLKDFIYSITNEYDVTQCSISQSSRCADGKVTHNISFICKSIENLQKICEKIITNKKLYIDYIDKIILESDEDLTNDSSEVNSDNDETSIEQSLKKNKCGLR